MDSFVAPVAGSQADPRARLTGFVYLLYFVTAIAGGALDGRGFTSYGMGVDLASNVVYAVLAVLLYRLFAPVNRAVSAIAAACGIAGSVVGVLQVVHRDPYHLDALVFFGPYCLLLGYLIVTSTFLPRALGILMLLAGVGWLVFLTPLGPRLTIGIEVLGIAAELLLMIWLLVAGVNVQRWRARAGI
jgi:hypothetical protein